MDCIIFFSIFENTQCITPYYLDIMMNGKASFIYENN